MIVQKLGLIVGLITAVFCCVGQNDIYPNCKILTTNVTQKEYDKAVKVWKDCLVEERLKEKTKAALYNDIKGNTIVGEYEFLEDKMSDEYLSYKALAKILTNEELIENIQSSNDVGIKYYSFLAVAEKRSENVFEMLKTLINDTTTVEALLTCGPNKNTLADLCIDIVTEKYFHNFINYKPKHYQLTLAEKEELDEIIYNADFKIKYKETLLNTTLKNE